MKPAAGHSGASVRHLAPPRGLAGHLHAWRFGLLRRLSQALVLMLFFGTLHFGWKLHGEPLLAGNLSAAKLAGALALADPLALLQLLATGHWPGGELLLGAAVTLTLYALLGGRVFCAWVCPMNTVTDLAALLRQRLGRATASDLVHLPAATRYVVLLLVLAVSAASGIAAFEAWSPVAALHRELIYGAGLGLGGAAGILLLDTFVIRRGWCGHLCPLGAFWSWVGRIGQLRIGFDESSCTRCGDCVKACPEPQALNLNALATQHFVAAGECTNCGRCIAVCPESSLRLDLRVRMRPRTQATAPDPGEQP